MDGSGGTVRLRAIAGGWRQCCARGLNFFERPARGPRSWHARPTEQARLGALANAPRLLQTGPRGRCPLVGGGWPWWNRAVRVEGAEGVTVCEGDGGREFVSGSDSILGNVSRSTSLSSRSKGVQGNVPRAAGGVGNITFYGYVYNFSVPRPSDQREDLATAVAAAVRLLVFVHISAIIGAAFCAAAARRCSSKRTSSTSEDAPRRRRRSRDHEASRPRGLSIGGRVALAAIIVGGTRRGFKGWRKGHKGILLDEPSLRSPFWKPWKTENDATTFRKDLEQCYDDILTLSGQEAPFARGPVAAKARNGDTPEDAYVTHRDLAAWRRPGPRRHRVAPRARLGLLHGRMAITALTLAGMCCRLGEAASTGHRPTGAGLSPIVMEWIGMEGRSAASYPMPHRDGFRDVSSPGFQEEERGRNTVGAEDFGLVAETVNSTGWGPLQRRLRATEAHIVCAQETWVLPGQVKSSSDWAYRNGWESVWAPARLGVGGGASGGVTVFARRGMGLRFPNVGPHILEEARAVAAMCDPPGHRPFMICSAYLIDGQGAGDANRSILGKISRAVGAHGDACMSLIGADFQCPPSAVQGTGFPDQLRGRILAASSARGTFRSSGASSNLDYFVAGGGLAEVVDRVYTVEASGIKGHVPI